MLFQAVILAFVALKAAEAQTPNLLCYSPVPYRCEIHSINLLQDQPRYNFLSPSPSEVTDVYVFGSKLAVFSRDFCQTFPNLTTLYVSSAGVEYLDPKAFDSCLKIREVYMSDNQIQVLPQRLFWNSALLVKVDLGNNRLGAISDDQFVKNVNLQKLYLPSNYLKAFPVSAVNGSRGALEELALYTNELNLLEVDKLLEFPELKKLWINGNTFSCAWLTRYLNAAKAKDFKLEEAYYQREKDFSLTTVEDFVCVLDSN